jgi:hypothetical protein
VILVPFPACFFLRLFIGLGNKKKQVTYIISEPPAPYHQATNIYNFTTTTLVFSLNRIGNYWIRGFCSYLAGTSIIAGFSTHLIVLYFRASSPCGIIILMRFLGYLLIHIPLVQYILGILYRKSPSKAYANFFSPPALA